jgi:peptidoglycan-associated lipoprotein
MALGDRRANSAKQFLIDLGIDAARLDTISYGEEKPVDAGHNEEAWAKNRRDHFIIK